MSIAYALVNWTRHEQLNCWQLCGCTGNELVKQPIVGSIVNTYLLQNKGDWIAYVAYEFVSWPFPSGSVADLDTYPNQVDAIIESLVENGTLYYAIPPHQLIDPDDPYRFLHHWTERILRAGDGCEQ